MVRALLFYSWNNKYSVFLFLILLVASAGDLKAQCDSTGKRATCNFYFDSGKLSKTGSYKNGERHGVWTYFSKDSVILKKEIYKRGRRKWTFYYEDGQIVRF